jgi:hypothetical protein
VIISLNCPAVGPHPGPVLYNAVFDTYNGDSITGCWVKGNSNWMLARTFMPEWVSAQPLEGLHHS